MNEVGGDVCFDLEKFEGEKHDEDENDDNFGGSLGESLGDLGLQGDLDFLLLVFFLDGLLFGGQFDEGVCSQTKFSLGRSDLVVGGRVDFGVGIEVDLRLLVEVAVLNASDALPVEELGRLEVERLGLLLSQFGLLVQLHDSYQPDQADHPDHTRYSPRPRGLRQVGCVLRSAASRQGIPDPRAVWNHANGGDEVKPEEEGKPVVLRNQRSKHNLNCEGDHAEQGAPVEYVVRILAERYHSDVVEEQGVDRY